MKQRFPLGGLTLLLPILAAGQGSQDITIVSPTEGEVFASGAVVPVVVEIDESLNPVEVAIVPSFAVDDISNHLVPFPFETEIELPEEYFGTAFVEVYVSSEPGGFPEAKKLVQFTVLPDSPVESVLATEDSLSLHVPPHRGSTARLVVLASLANGQLVGVERAGIPVTFESDDSGVATVSAEGLISAIAPGRAWVTVHHGDLDYWIDVSVRDPETGIGPAPIDISPNVAILSTGFRVAPETNQIVELIRVTNISTGPLHRPFSVVIDGLPEGVVVASPDGRTRAVTPIGAPFMDLVLEEGDVHFMPGDSGTVEVRYLNPGGRPINRNVRVFNRSGP